jgi:hypothetical protein
MWLTRPTVQQLQVLEKNRFWGPEALKTSTVCDLYQNKVLVSSFDNAVAVIDTKVHSLQQATSLLPSVQRLNGWPFPVTL